MKKILLALLIFVSAFGYSQQTTVDAYTLRARTQIFLNGSNGTVNRGVRLNNSNFSDNQGWMDLYPASGLNVSAGLRIVPRGTGKTGNAVTQFDMYRTDYLASQTNYEKMTFVGRESPGSFGINIMAAGTGIFRPFDIRINNTALTTWTQTGITNTVPTGYTTAIPIATLGANDFITKNHLALMADSIHIQGVSTLNAVQATLDTLYIPTGFAVTVNIKMHGENNANSEVFGGEKAIVIKNIGGTYTIIGSIQTVVADQKESSLSTISWTVAIVNSLPMIRVTGVASTTIVWEATYTKTFKDLN